jgi:hypothetical protein
MKRKGTVQNQKLAKLSNSKTTSPSEMFPGNQSLTTLIGLK